MARASRCRARNASSPARLTSSMPPLWMTNAALPVVAAIEHHQDLARREAAQHLSGSSGVRERRNHSTSIGAPRSSTGRPAFSRTIECRPSAPIDQLGSNLDRAVRRARPDAGDASVACRSDRRPRRPSADRNVRIAPSVLGEEIEKIPLRHEDEELAVRRQVREVGERDELVADLAADLLDLLSAGASGIHPAGRARASPRASTDESCRRESRGGSRDASRARRRPRRRGRADSRASSRRGRRRRCSIACSSRPNR